MGKKRLFLIDGMSNIFRAYYAIRGLSTSRGFPTNAIYGFTTMLKKLITEEKPDYLAVVFDTAEPTFRHAMFPPYKATRSEMPDDLAEQIPYIYRVCEALRLPVLTQPGYEADDIIATLARRAAGQGIDVVVVSNDKDLCQIVGKNIRILKADRQNYVYYDEKGVQERLGVKPSQVVDYLALVGDPVDNIPGAPGIGEKGAAQIIGQFGSLEKALENWDKVEKRSYRESLRDHRQQILQARELLTLRLDVPLDIDFSQLLYVGPDVTKVRELFAELEFSSLLKELLAVYGTTEKAPAVVSVLTEVSGTYRRIVDPSERATVMEKIWRTDRLAFSLDMKDHEIVGIGLATEPHRADYLDLQQAQIGIGELRDVFENGLIAKLGHDLKIAYKQLGPKGLWLEGVADDVMIAGWLLNPNRGKYDLPTLVGDHLQVDWPEDELSWRARAREADFIWRLSQVLDRRLEEMGLQGVYRQIELPLIEILAEMERAGVKIDVQALADVSREMDGEIERLSGEIYKVAGREFNINSPQQLGDILEELGLVVTRRTKKTGRIATSADVLEDLARTHPLPRLVLDYRELVKLKGTYVEALPKLICPETGRVHTTFHQTGTATGRLSSSAPNVQNIPIRTEWGQRIRRAFMAEEGWLLLSADYSQIELRLLAHITGDEAMTEAFRQGADIHAHVARTVFGAQTPEEVRDLRRLAKIVNFGIAYSIGAFGLAQRIGVSRREAQRIIDNYFRTYPGVRRYIEEIPQQARQSGYVRTLCGRIRPIPDIANKNPNLRARAEREAINAPIQGAAADLVKMAMIRVHARLKEERLKSRMLLQVHDELLVEVPESEREIVPPLVKTEMENVYSLTVPLVVVVGLGRNWLDAKSE
jgi:DNA polymerase-1